MSLLRFTPKTAPIMGLVGTNGSGKTAQGVGVVIRQALRSGRPIFSTLPIEYPGVEVHPVRGLADLLHAEGVHVFFDEISAVAPARETMTNTPQIVARLASLRHVDCTLVWTAPVMGDVDVKIRAVTQSVVSCNPIRSHEVEDQLWPNTTLSYATQYNIVSNLVTDINSETPKMGRGFFRMKHLPLDHYNTRSDVELTADHAVCPDCGLTRRREYCKGNHSEKVARDPARENVGSHDAATTSIPEAKASEAVQSRPHARHTQPLTGAGARPSTIAPLGLDGTAGGATLEGSR